MLACLSRFQVRNARGERSWQNEGTWSGDLKRDVERQDLIGVPRRRQRLEAGDLGQLDVVQVVDGVSNGQAVHGTNQLAVEDRRLVERNQAIGLELRSMFARKRSWAFANKSRSAWRSKLIQISDPAMPRLLREYARGSALPIVKIGAFSRVTL